ncbi:hypothetical protein PRZ48_006854 [Zasmidium cellare]|uniref:NmrA-like domain-containing protein n=1 Tax=Zasmidium cellare TaxID=395010 RepID=A0ABR0EIM0_ZASCE|nr:hypothetical protein PRZ48_006854 [Zasmidium cellare]
MSSKKKLLVILGITGQQGSSIATLFLKDPQLRSTYSLRGITRNPSKASNKHLLDAGVELVAGDLDDVQSLKKAFKGADAIFAVTDFWQFVQPEQHPSTFQEAEKRGVKPNVVAMEKEVVQGKNIVDAAAAVHAEKPLHRLVISTLSDSKKWSTGEIANNLHFDGKAHYCEYLKEKYPSLGKATSYVQVGFYMSNFTSNPFWAPHKDPKKPDEYIIPHGSVAEPKHLVPFVDPPNDVGYFVEALLNRAPPETDMLGYGKELSVDEFAAVFGKALGVKARSERVEREALVALGVPDWLAEEVSESGQYATKWGWTGGDSNVKTPEECGVDMSKLTDVGEWIKAQDWKL